ncbi:MAG TPA: RNA polymerase sigma factor [Tepidisphaeraceae bacterium]|jgi:RNA polymerase sigma-70 factor (ECF subfamily)
MADKHEFERQLESVRARLVRSAAVLCWAGADVEDVVQETLLEALRSRQSFGDRSSVLTWAYVILTRVAARVNARRRERAVATDWAALADGLPPVDGGLIADEAHRAVADAVRRLPQRQREMVTLHFLEDLTYAEISTALGVSVGTVKATIFEAKASLRTALCALQKESR